MPKVDLGLLRERGRLEIEVDLPPDDPLWKGSGIQLEVPLSVRLDVEEADADILVRGQLSGAAGVECRRCLEPVTVPIDEEVAWLFRTGVDPAEAEDQEVYAVSERTLELDLGTPIREQLLLAVPKYSVCRAACRGLCPVCGKNLNEATCECDTAEADDRWAPLRRLKKD